MTTARDIRHPGAECVGATESLAAAARKMRALGVSAHLRPGRPLQGIVTDRDIVVRCVAEGGDPARVRAGDLAQGQPVWARPPPRSARC
jgi:CBS domain-containing protein